MNEPEDIVEDGHCYECGHSLWIVCPKCNNLLPPSEFVATTPPPALTDGDVVERIAKDHIAAAIDRLCHDSEVWATHGLPPDHKLDRLETEMVAAFRAALVEVGGLK